MLGMGVRRRSSGMPCTSGFLKLQQKRLFS